MKRVYHQLDWRDRGYLYRTDIERCCIEASKETKMSIDHKALMKLVFSVDLNRDGEYCIASYRLARLPKISWSLEHYIYCTCRELSYRIVDGSLSPTIHGENSFLRPTLQARVKTRRPYPLGAISLGLTTRLSS